MKFRRTPQFKEDYNNLSEADRIAVDNAFNNVSLALQGNNQLQKYFSIHKMEGWHDIWEGHVKRNLCFTFNFTRNDTGEKICFFRRIGTHDIYDAP